MCRKALFAVALSFLVMIGQVGCGGGGSTPSAGSSAGSSVVMGSDGASVAGPVSGDAAPAAVSGDGVAKLSWNPAIDGAAGFKVYVGTASGSYGTTIDVGMASDYSVTGLAPGTYYFSITAYDGTGSESAYSNEVSKTIS